VQRLLQMQVGFTFFYTALYKVTAQGNWITDNPLFYVLNYPSPGVTKTFLLRDFLQEMPGLVYWSGIFIVIVEVCIVFFLLLVISYLTVVTIVGIMWMADGRFLIPIMPYIAIIAAYGWGQFRNKISE